MTEQTIDQKVNTWTRIGAVLLFLVFGAGIMLVFSPWNPMMTPKWDLLGRIGLILVLGALSLAAKKWQKAKTLWPLLSGLLIMAVAVSLTWIIANYLVDNLGLSGKDPRGFALLKLNDLVVIGVIVIGMSRCFGFNFNDLYLQVGKVKLGLIFGLGLFLVAAATAVPSGQFLFKLDASKLAGWEKWIGWLLLFVLANGFMEELLFRGLFLKKLEPLLGEFFASLTIAVVFSALHFGVGYTSDQWMFQVILMLLAMAFAAVMQKTRALWPAALFHAGMDISIMLGIFSNLH
jgi:membrane protease YdiL (CAAX protease family)